MVAVIEISEDDESLIEEEEEEAEEEEESIMSDSIKANSDDDKDQDFLIAQANGRVKAKQSPSKAIKLNFSPDALAEKFTCDYCQRTFKAKQGLTRHVQSHIESSVPWKCNVIDCDYATSSKIKLNNHKYELHAIPLPLPKVANGVAAEKKRPPETVTSPASVVPGFSCFCGATFNSMFSLRAHKK